jgi:hypothetical protein
MVPGHLTQQEFENSFLMTKEVTIPTTWSECNLLLLATAQLYRPVSTAVHGQVIQVTAHTSSVHHHS